MANKPTPADFSPNVPDFPSIGQYQPIYGKFDLTTYIQGASDYEIMSFLVQCYNATLKGYSDVTQLSKDTATAYNQLQTWVNDWFSDLDVSQEINSKIDAMVADGSFGTLLHKTFDSQINTNTTSAVTAWLAANVNPVGSAVTVDKSLSIDGSAADSKQTGISISYANSGCMQGPNNTCAFDTVNHTVTIDQFLAGRAVHDVTTKTLTYDTSKVFAYVILDGNGNTPKIVYESPNSNVNWLFTFITNADFLRTFKGCTLPPNCYSVDGTIMLNNYMFNIAFIEGGKYVNFDTTLKTVFISGFYGNNAVPIPETTLTYDESNVTAYVVIKNNIPSIKYTPPTNGQQYLFHFFTNSNLINNYNSCSLPVTTYKVNGVCYNEKITDVQSGLNNGWLTENNQPVEFDTVNNTVKVIGWRAGRALDEFPPATVSYDTSHVTAYVVRNADKTLSVQYTEPTAKQIWLFTFFTNAAILKGFAGCTLPVNCYTVDGTTYSIDTSMFNNAVLSDPLNGVKFDTTNKTVTISCFFGGRRVTSWNDATLTYDDTKVTAYVVRENNEFKIRYEEPTNGQTWLFTFFTNARLLKGFGACTLPVSVYTVDGVKYSGNQEYILNLAEDIKDRISLSNVKIDINGNYHVLDLGEHFPVTTAGKFTIDYEAEEGGEVYKVFISKEKSLMSDTRIPYPFVTLWAFGGAKPVKLTPYYTTDEVDTNANSFTYVDGYFYINCEDATEIVKNPDGSDKDAITIESCTGNIRNLIVRFASETSLHAYRSNINLNNCIFEYSKAGGGVHYTDTSGTIENCQAYYVTYDGFGFDQISNDTSGGGTTIINCIAAHCGDDAFSHHQNHNSFSFISCEGYDCGKGGISSPTYSCWGNIHNCYLHDNTYGIYADTTDENPKNPNGVNVFNTVISNNKVGIRNAYDMRLYNCKETGNETQREIIKQGTITEL